MVGTMSNPKLGLFELQGLLDMSDDKFLEYLQSAGIAYRGHEGPMPIDVLRSLLLVLRQIGDIEEADLREREAKGQDVKGHIAYDIRRVAWFATISSVPIGNWISWHKYGVDVDRL